MVEGKSTHDDKESLLMGQVVIIVKVSLDSRQISLRCCALLTPPERIFRLSALSVSGHSLMPGSRDKDLGKDDRDHHHPQTN